ncbi:Mg2+ and Co2+ transporter CorA [Kitasatospora sp. MAP12-15]|uniref:hypothetical protein n=1 Tax=unclassified Kitasatospora TaxID=2633591 RepID=UPI0024731507|nr:hypothetical protein [Kitasatospora sp. MAP12-44]MDH6110225.1 Mg2+ and Co2+ transporter CorA [Kitasatospora sp. MAP12-44]
MVKTGAGLFENPNREEEDSMHIVARLRDLFRRPQAPAVLSDDAFEQIMNRTAGLAARLELIKAEVEAQKTAVVVEESPTVEEIEHAAGQLIRARKLASEARALEGQAKRTLDRAPSGLHGATLIERTKNSDIVSKSKMVKILEVRGIALPMDSRSDTINVKFVTATALAA